jgi:NAD(P)H-hydrate repair Nnr-like enzyme with NAD(P)H-hydrate epimerase domain
MTDPAKTMTLNLSEREMAVLSQLAAEFDMSKTAVMRQALRLYQLVHERIKAGETMSFIGDKERIALFIGPGFGEQP